MIKITFRDAHDPEDVPDTEFFWCAEALVDWMKINWDKYIMCTEIVEGY